MEADVTTTKLKMDGVREYCEQYPVELELVPPSHEGMPEYGPPAAEGPRWCVLARNEGSCNSTRVDLIDLIAWLRANRSELITSIIGEPSAAAIITLTIERDGATHLSTAQRAEATSPRAAAAFDNLIAAINAVMDARRDAEGKAFS
jgi:hypothetical protein